MDPERWFYAVSRWRQMHLIKGHTYIYIALKMLKNNFGKFRSVKYWPRLREFPLDFKC